MPYSNQNNNDEDAIIIGQQSKPPKYYINYGAVEGAYQTQGSAPEPEWGGRQTIAQPLPEQESDSFFGSIYNKVRHWFDDSPEDISRNNMFKQQLDAIANGSGPSYVPRDSYGINQNYGMNDILGGVQSKKIVLQPLNNNTSNVFRYYTDPQTGQVSQETVPIGQIVNGQYRPFKYTQDIYQPGEANLPVLGKTDILGTAVPGLYALRKIIGATTEANSPSISEAEFAQKARQQKSGVIQGLYDVQSPLEKIVYAGNRLITGQPEITKTEYQQTGDAGYTGGKQYGQTAADVVAAIGAAVATGGAGGGLVLSGSAASAPHIVDLLNDLASGRQNLKSAAALSLLDLGANIGGMKVGSKIMMQTKPSLLTKIIEDVGANAGIMGGYTALSSPINQGKTGEAFNAQDFTRELLTQMSIGALMGGMFHLTEAKTIKMAREFRGDVAAGVPPDEIKLKMAQQFDPKAKYDSYDAVDKQVKAKVEKVYEEAIKGVNIPKQEEPQTSPIPEEKALIPQGEAVAGYPPPAENLSPLQSELRQAIDAMTAAGEDNAAQKIANKLGLLANSKESVVLDALKNPDNYAKFQEFTKPFTVKFQTDNLHQDMMDKASSIKTKADSQPAQEATVNFIMKASETHSPNEIVNRLMELPQTKGDMLKVANLYNYIAQEKGLPEFRLEDRPEIKSILESTVPDQEKIFDIRDALGVNSKDKEALQNIEEWYNNYSQKEAERYSPYSDQIQQGLARRDVVNNIIDGEYGGDYTKENFSKANAKYDELAANPIQKRIDEPQGEPVPTQPELAPQVVKDMVDNLDITIRRREPELNKVADKVLKDVDAIVRSRSSQEAVRSEVKGELLKNFNEMTDKLNKNKNVPNPTELETDIALLEVANKFKQKAMGIEEPKPVSRQVMEDAITQKIPQEEVRAMTNKLIDDGIEEHSLALQKAETPQPSQNEVKAEQLVQTAKPEPVQSQAEPIRTEPVKPEQRQFPPLEKKSRTKSVKPEPVKIEVKSGTPEGILKQSEPDITEITKRKGANQTPEEQEIVRLKNELRDNVYLHDTDAKLNEKGQLDPSGFSQKITVGKKILVSDYLKYMENNAQSFRDAGNLVPQRTLNSIERAKAQITKAEELAPKLQEAILKKKEVLTSVENNPEIPKLIEEYDKAAKDFGKQSLIEYHSKSPDTARTDEFLAKAEGIRKRLEGINSPKIQKQIKEIDNLVEQGKSYINPEKAGTTAKSLTNKDIQFARKVGVDESSIQKMTNFKYAAPEKVEKIAVTKASETSKYVNEVFSNPEKTFNKTPLQRHPEKIYNEFALKIAKEYGIKETNPTAIADEFMSKIDFNNPNDMARWNRLEEFATNARLKNQTVLMSDLKREIADNIDNVEKIYENAEILHEAADRAESAETPAEQLPDFSTDEAINAIKMDDILSSPKEVPTLDAVAGIGKDTYESYKSDLEKIGRSLLESPSLSEKSKKFIQNHLNKIDNPKHEALLLNSVNMAGDPQKVAEFNAKHSDYLSKKVPIAFQSNAIALAMMGAGLAGENQDDDNWFKKIAPWLGFAGMMALAGKYGRKTMRQMGEEWLGKIKSIPKERAIGKAVARERAGTQISPFGHYLNFLRKTDPMLAYKLAWEVQMEPARIEGIYREAANKIEKQIGKFKNEALRYVAEEVNRNIYLNNVQIQKQFGEYRTEKVGLMSQTQKNELIAKSRTPEYIKEKLLKELPKELKGKLDDTYKIYELIRDKKRAMEASVALGQKFGERFGDDAKKFGVELDALNESYYKPQRRELDAKRKEFNKPYMEKIVKSEGEILNAKDDLKAAKKAGDAKLMESAQARIDAAKEAVSQDKKMIKNNPYNAQWKEVNDKIRRLHEIQHRIVFNDQMQHVYTPINPDNYSFRIEEKPVKLSDGTMSTPETKIRIAYKSESALRKGVKEYTEKLGLFEKEGKWYAKNRMDIHGNITPAKEPYEVAFNKKIEPVSPLSMFANEQLISKITKYALDHNGDLSVLKDTELHDLINSTLSGARINDSQFMNGQIQQLNFLKDAIETGHQYSADGLINGLLRTLRTRRSPLGSSLNENMGFYLGEKTPRERLSDLHDYEERLSTANRTNMERQSMIALGQEEIMDAVKLGKTDEAYLRGIQHQIERFSVPRNVYGDVKVYINGRPTNIVNGFEKLVGTQAAAMLSSFRAPIKNYIDAAIMTPVHRINSGDAFVSTMKNYATGNIKAIQNTVQDISVKNAEKSLFKNPDISAAWKMADKAGVFMENLPVHAETFKLFEKVKDIVLFFLKYSETEARLMTWTAGAEAAKQNLPFSEWKGTRKEYQQFLATMGEIDVSVIEGLYDRKNMPDWVNRIRDIPGVRTITTFAKPYVNKSYYILKMARDAALAANRVERFNAFKGLVTLGAFGLALGGSMSVLGAADVLRTINNVNSWFNSEKDPWITKGSMIEKFWNSLTIQAKKFGISENTMGKIYDVLMYGVPSNIMGADLGLEDSISGFMNPFVLSSITGAIGVGLKEDGNLGDKLQSMALAYFVPPLLKNAARGTKQLMAGHPLDKEGQQLSGDYNFYDAVKETFLGKSLSQKSEQDKKFTWAQGLSTQKGREDFVQRSMGGEGLDIYVNGQKIKKSMAKEQLPQANVVDARVMWDKVRALYHDSKYQDAIEKSVEKAEEYWKKHENDLQKHFLGTSKADVIGNNKEMDNLYGQIRTTIENYYASIATAKAWNYAVLKKGYQMGFNPRSKPDEAAYILGAPFDEQGYRAVILKIKYKEFNQEKDAGQR